MDRLHKFRTHCDLLILVAVLVILAGFYLRYAPTKLAYYTDPLIYLSGAESLAEGNGYRFVAHAGTPRIACHPPLQSAYLSLFWRLDPHFPANIKLLYAAMVLSVFATFILFYRYCLRNGVPGLVAGLVILSWGLSMQWGTLLYCFMSDVTFGLLWMVLAYYWLDAQDSDSAPRWFITGVIVLLMYLTRTAALAVIVTLAGVAAWRAWNRAQIKPLLAYLAPVLPGIALWNLWAVGSPGYNDYIKFRVSEAGGFSATVHYCLNCAQDYLSGMGFTRSVFTALMDCPSIPSLVQTAWSPILTAATLGLSWLLMLLWMVGCWRAGTVKERIGGLVVGVYLVQLCLYPVGLGDRALYAVLPLVLVWAWKGRALLPRTITQSKACLWVGVIFLSLNVIGNARSFAMAMTYLDTCSHPDELKEVGEWLRQNSPPETVVAATLSEPVMHFYHYSGRKVVENYFQKQPWFSIAGNSVVGTRNADYMLLDWYSYLKIEDLNFRSFRLVKSSSQGRYRLYRVGLGRRPERISRAWTGG